MLEPAAVASSPKMRGIQRSFVIVRLVLEKSELHRRIALRTQGMYAEGLVQEAVAVRSAASLAPALNIIGYAEALSFWDGLATYTEAIERTVKRTQRYAKRQETWFRHMLDAKAIDASSYGGAAERIVALARERFV